MFDRLLDKGNEASDDKGLEEFSIRLGRVSKINPDLSVDLVTAEGQTIKKVLRVAPTKHFTFPPPTPGTVVVWAFIDGGCEQAVYFGEIFTSASSVPTTGLFEIHANTINFVSSARTRINGVDVARIGARDSRGDTIVSSGQ